MNNPAPKLGVTLFSFTNEWQQQLHTLDTMIARVAEMKLGPGIEVVGFQSFRSFPDIPDDEARHFRNMLDKYGLTPTCLGANIDIGRRRDRLMTAEEILDVVKRQLISAKKLGFPIMRVPPSAGNSTLESLPFPGRKIPGPAGGRAAFPAQRGSSRGRPLARDVRAPGFALFGLHP